MTERSDALTTGAEGGLGIARGWNQSFDKLAASLR